MNTLRKLFTSAIMMVTILSLSVVAAPASAASAGDLVKVDGSSAVYYLGSDMRLYVFPNEDAYFSWYSDFSSVVTISATELNSYGAPKANITVRPGTKLVKRPVPTAPAVYAVEPGGTLRHIADEATAKTLYGDNWASRVVDVVDSFFTNYKADAATTNPVTATAYPAGSLVKWAGSADVYYITTDGDARKVANESAFVANRFSWDAVLTAPASISKPTEGTQITGYVADIAAPTSGATGVGTVPGTGTGLSVAVASDTPAAASLPQNAALAEFTKFNVTAASDGAVTIKNLTVTRSGLGEAADISGVYIYDGSTRLTSARTVSATSNTATFSGLNYTVPAGTTKTLSIRATVADTSGNHQLGIASASDITTNGASVSGSFPVTGNTMTLTSVSAGVVTFTYQTPANSTLKVGETQREVAKFKLDANSAEDAVLQAITLTNEGGADANDLRNFKLYQGTTLVAEKATNDSDTLTLTPTNTLTIGKSTSKTFTLKADIMGGVGSGAIKYELDEVTDLVAKGSTYGYNVGVTSSGSSTSITVEAGELTIEFDGPAAQSIDDDADDVTLVSMTITTGGDEAVEVKNLYALIDGTENSAGNNLQTGLSNVRLVRTDGTDAVDATSDDGSADDDYYVKFTNFTAPAGASKWKIEADLDATYFDSSDTLKVSIYAAADTTGGGGTSAKRGIEAENKDGKALDDVKPGTTIESNLTTIETAGLTVTNKVLSNGNAVLKEKGVELIRLTLKAGSSEDVRVTQIAFEDSTTGGGTANNLADAANYTLWLVDTNNVLTTKIQSGVSSASSGATVTLSDLSYNGISGLKIPKGETFTVAVTGDINSATSTAGNIVQIKLSADGTTAEDADGNSLADGSISGDDTAIDGRVVTINMSGTIAFDMASDTPDKQALLISGSTGNTIAKFKANASYEDIVLKTLNFTNTASSTTNTSNGSVAALELWYDADGSGSGAPVQVARKTAFAAALDEIQFTDLDKLATPVTVKKDIDGLFELRMDVAGIGSDASDTASSSETVTFKLTSVSDVAARGNSSNSDLAASAISTSSHITSQTQTIYAARVTAALSTDQSKTLSSGEETALKFTLTPTSNESFTNKLDSVNVNWSDSGAVVVYGFKLYNGAGTEVASSAGNMSSSSTGTVTLTLTTDDDINGSGETYTVKVFTHSADADDKVSVDVDVNGNGGSGDDIIWKDGSGSDGNITWIYLGQDSTTNELKNTLSY